MVLFGSAAAVQRGIPLGRPIKDLDIICTRVEFDQFLTRNRRHILNARIFHGHRGHVTFRPETRLPKAEFEFEQSPSDVLLCNMKFDRQTSLLDTPLRVISPNILFLIKRAIADMPANFERDLRDLLLLKPHVSDFSTDECEFYRLRRQESWRRFARFRTTRISLVLPTEDFYELSNHVRFLEHEDLRKAVAFEAGQPVHDHATSGGKVDREQFLALPREIQLRMPREEFMATGIGRYFLHDRQLTSQQVYWLGLLKTLRDHYTGWLQDYCLDNIEHLARLPTHDFLAQFLTAESTGAIRRVGHARRADTVRTIDQAIRLEKEDRNHDADRLLDILLASDPTHPIALYCKGLLAQKQGDHDAAIRYLQASVDAERGNWQAWNLLGQMLFERREPDAAARCFNLALTARPDFLPALINGANIQQKLGRTEEAIRLLRRASALAPEDELVSSRLNRLQST